MNDESASLAPLLKGDKAAWDRFVARFAPVIYAAIHRRLAPAGRSGEAEDVAQDVFMKLCKADFKLLRGYDPARAKLTTWLTVITASTVIDHLRRQRQTLAPIDEVPERFLAVEPTLTEKVKIPPDLLSPRQALVVEMLYRRELEVAEAAAILGVDPQTVRSTHHKALTKLRAHFAEDG